MEGPGAAVCEGEGEDIAGELADAREAVGAVGPVGRAAEDVGAAGAVVDRHGGCGARTGLDEDVAGEIPAGAVAGADRGHRAVGHDPRDRRTGGADEGEGVVFQADLAGEAVAAGGEAMRGGIVGTGVFVIAITRPAPSRMGANGVLLHHHADAGHRDRGVGRDHVAIIVVVEVVAWAGASGRGVSRVLLDHDTDSRDRNRGVERNRRGGRQRARRGVGGEAGLGDADVHIDRAEGGTAAIGDRGGKDVASGNEPTGEGGGPLAGSAGDEGGGDRTESFNLQGEERTIRDTLAGEHERAAGRGKHRFRNREHLRLGLDDPIERAGGSANGVRPLGDAAARLHNSDAGPSATTATASPEVGGFLDVVTDAVDGIPTELHLLSRQARRELEQRRRNRGVCAGDDNQ